MGEHNSSSNITKNEVELTFYSLIIRAWIRFLASSREIFLSPGLTVEFLLVYVDRCLSWNWGAGGKNERHGWLTCTCSCQKLHRFLFPFISLNRLDLLKQLICSLISKEFRGVINIISYVLYVRLVFHLYSVFLFLSPLFSLFLRLFFFWICYPSLRIDCLFMLQ